MMKFWLVLLSTIVVLAHGWGGGEECKQGTLPLLVTTKGSSQLKLGPNILEFLRDPIRRNSKIVIISVIGAARSGKSFSMNYLTQCPSLFEVGHDSDPMTKGAWAYPMDLGNGTIILFVDSEGLEDIASIHDKPLLQFITLASSHVIYHKAGPLARADVEHMVSIAQLLDALEGHSLSRRIKLPPMTWIFGQYKLNEPPDDSNILRIIGTAPDTKSQDAVEEHDRAVMRIKENLNYKPVYVPPATPENVDSKNLDTIPFNNLTEGFRTKMDEVRETLKGVEPKQLTKGGEAMTCLEYANLLEFIINAVNTKIDSGELWKIIVNNAATFAEKAYDHYMVNIERKFPIELDEWNEYQGDAYKEARKIFRRRCFDQSTDQGDNETTTNSEYYKQSLTNLTHALDKITEEYKNTYYKQCQRRCTEEVEDFRNWLRERNCFEDPGCLPESEAASRGRNIVGPVSKECQEKLSREILLGRIRDSLWVIVGIMVVSVLVIAFSVLYRRQLGEMMFLDAFMPIITIISGGLILLTIVCLLLQRPDYMTRFIFEPTIEFFLALLAVFITPLIISLARRVNNGPHRQIGLDGKPMPIVIGPDGKPMPIMIGPDGKPMPEPPLISPQSSNDPQVPQVPDIRK